MSSNESTPEFKQRRRGVILTFVALACIFLAAPAYASEPDYTDFELGELLDMDLVYGASRYEQKVSDAPAAVTVITAEEIQAYGYRTLDSVLESVAGFYTSYDRAYSYIGVRGFSQPDDYNTRVLVLVDGHRVNDNVYSSGPGGTDFPLDLDLVKRVEVIRGPSSSLYGTSAFFGVVNIVTRDAADFEGTEVSGIVSNEGGGIGRLSVGRSTDAGLDWIASVGGSDLPGRDLYYGEFDDPASNSGRATDADGRQEVRFFSKMQWNGLRLHLAHSRRDKVIPTAYYGTVFNDPGTVNRDERSWLELSYDRQAFGDGSLQMRLSYDRYKFLGYYRYDYADPGDPPYVVTNRDLNDGKWLDAEMRWTGRPLRRHRIVAGMSGRRNLRADQRNWDQETGDEYMDVNTSSDEWGLFLQDEITLHSRLRLSLGIRHDLYEGFAGATSPRIAVILEPRERTTVKMLYGRAFRAPNAYESFYDDGDVQKGNPDLIPETMDHLELVVEQSIGQRLRLSTSLFHSDIDKLITQTVDPADDMIVFQNLDDYSSNGFEFSADARLLPGIRGRGSYSYQNTRGTSGGRAVNSPHHLAKMNLMAPVRSSGATAGLELQYTSERLTRTGATTDAFLLAHLSLRQSAMLDRVSITATIYNLFDVKYADPVSDAFLQDSIQQDGRTLALRTEVRW